MEPNSSNTINRKSSLGILPEEIQFIFNNEMVTNSVAAIKELHALDVTQATDLENEIVLTLLGLEFVSNFESRAKQAVGATDEKLADLLEDVAGMLFTAEIMAILNEMEEAAIKTETFVKKAEPLTPTNLPTAEKAPIPQPGITVKPPEPIVPSDKVATLRDLPERPKKEIPTGKMVGLTKETAESTIKGMRTMRGDINRLRGPENENGGGSSFTKPFKGN